MSKWYEKHYINKIYWIIDQLENLKLTSEEALLVLLIQYLNESQKPIDYHLLASKMKVDVEHIDELLSGLMEKAYLEVIVSNQKIEFNLEGVFEEEVKDNSFNESLFEQFQSEFGRPLSSVELQRLSEWIEQYDLKLITYALREAVAYDHLNFNYIDRILYTWKSKGITAEKYERGEL